MNKPILLYIPLYTPSFNKVINLAMSRKGKFSLYNELKKQLNRNIKLIVQSQFKGTIDYRCTFKFLWIRKTKREDPDNIAFCKKFILDGLTHAKIFKNDGWEEIGEFRDRFLKGKTPGVIIEITKYIEEDKEWNFNTGHLPPQAVKYLQMQ